ncbi:MAG: hypothetical protein IKA16_02155 [Oscillospiraceae bacterium]|nr:hypothetical protein [Oscillospiraceae bacterium]
MKHNIVFKFIAILLCAASLLGAIGSGIGILALTEHDLYNKTVDQVKEERTRESAEHYAENLALMYTSTELGGSPEAMVESMLRYFGFEEFFGTYGYTITDAEGNVVSSYRPELAEAAGITTYTVPASGQYAHLVSLESQEEIDAREAAQKASRTMNAYDFGRGNSQIPAQGILVNNVMFMGRDGAPVYEATCYNYEYNVTYHYENSSNGYGVGSQTNCTGFLICNPDGQLVYTSFETERYEPLPETEIYGFSFLNEDEGFSFFWMEDKPVGELRLSNNRDVVTFLSTPLAEEPVEESQPAAEPTIAEETVPETTEALIEETVFPTEATIAVDENGNPIETSAPAEETTPTEALEATEAAEETSPVETAMEETVPSSASAIPEETAAAENPDPDAVPMETEALMTDPTAPAETVAETLPPETVPETLPEETIPEETVPEETEPLLINGKTLDHYQVNTQKYHDRQWMQAKFVYLPMPELEVSVYVDQNSVYNQPMYDLLTVVRSVRNYLLPALGICLLVFAVFTVYLCTAAGRKPKTEEVRAGGLNRLPLDLYLCGASFAIALIIVYIAEGGYYLFQRDFLTALGLTAAAAFAACLIFVGFCFAFVAQIKTPGGFWWRNTLCGHCIRLFMRFGVWLERYLRDKGFPSLWNLCKKLWNLTIKAIVWCFRSFEQASLWLISKLGRFFHWTGEKLRRFFAMIPLTWQWIVCGMVLFCMILIAANSRSVFLIWVCLIGSFALIFYGAHCFGVLLDSTKKMAKGDLDSKVEDKLLVGAFEEFASDLNDLADVAVVAAQKQLKSERMKTELITNVSHDIKTPLTSIINYVDLLQKPHTDEEEVQYLEVLDRQSQRLKKLIDDLMDMSKASTGNMTVDIERVDAVESVNQALGEFADKLNRANLIPVFRHDDPSVPMMADGKLVWRVLSNLLGNAVKYAMPGTRLYVDLMVLEGKVVLSLKNISREELNIDAEELMERFVRGDDSRNTEGSGLGLNIAKSLMELQKGQLQLLVDGDLFKVTLIFPGA